MRILAGLLLLVALASDLGAETVGVLYADGRPSEVLEARREGEVIFISADDVARLLNLETTWDRSLKRMVLSDDNHRLEILAGASVWLIDGRTIPARGATLLDRGMILIGVESAATVIAPAFGKSLRWEPKLHRLIVGLASPNILDLQVNAISGRMSLKVITETLVRYRQMPVGGDQVELFIPGGVLAKDLGFASEGGLVRSFESHQEAEGVRFVITFGDYSLNYRIFPTRSPSAIVIVVHRVDVGEIPEPNLRPPKRLVWEEKLSAQRDTIDLVVIDPGHGGENFGSVGPTGYTEKEANLAIARKVREQLEAKGIDVILTRNDDIFVDLETRTEVANSVGADLFISIHANGYGSSKACGFEVYFLSPPLDDEARVVAAMENAGIGVVAAENVVPNDEVAFILWDTAQNEFVAESSYLAQLIDEQLALRLPIRNRGVKQADFVVLKGAYLPAVLIETAFITNPDEENLLKDEAFQSQVADALVEAILRFKQDYRR